MENYELIASWIGWPATTAVLILVIPLLIWLLQRNITILRDENNFLKIKLDEAKNSSPDVLLDRVSTKYDLAIKELEELSKDKAINTVLVNEKINEIDNLKSLINKFVEKTEQLEEFSSNFKCPNCGAAQISHEFFPIWGEINGKDIDGDLEQTTYDCGLIVKDGQVIQPCKNIKNKLKQ